MKIFTFCFIALAGCTNQEFVIERWDNGEIKTRKIHINERDSLQFFLEQYSQNGQLILRTNYNNQYKDGWEISYYENGQIKDSIFYRENTTVLQAKGFHRNGKLKWTGEYDEDTGGKDGPWSFFDSLGRITYQTQYVNSVEEGTSFYFDKNGSVIREVRRYRGGVTNEDLSYKKGVLHGAYTKYFISGQTELSGEYVNGGKKNTTWTQFHQNGDKFLEYYYEDEDGWNVKMLNIWEDNGRQVVTNGNGKHITFEYCRNKSKKRKYITHYREGRVIDEKIVRLNACR